MSLCLTTEDCGSVASKRIENSFQELWIPASPRQAVYVALMFLVRVGAAQLLPLRKKQQVWGKFLFDWHNLREMLGEELSAMYSQCAGGATYHPC